AKPGEDFTIEEIWTHTIEGLSKSRDVAQAVDRGLSREAKARISALKEIFQRGRDFGYTAAANISFALDILDQGQLSESTDKETGMPIREYKLDDNRRSVSVIHDESQGVMRFKVRDQGQAIRVENGDQLSKDDVRLALGRLNLSAEERDSIKSVIVADSSSLGGAAFAMVNQDNALVINQDNLAALTSKQQQGEASFSRRANVETRSELGLSTQSTGTGKVIRMGSLDYEIEQQLPTAQYMSASEQAMTTAQGEYDFERIAVARLQAAKERSITDSVKLDVRAKVAENLMESDPMAMLVNQAILRDDIRQPLVQAVGSDKAYRSIIAAPLEVSGVSAQSDVLLGALQSMPQLQIQDLGQILRLSGDTTSAANALVDVNSSAMKVVGPTNIAPEKLQAIGELIRLKPAVAQRLIAAQNAEGAALDPSVTAELAKIQTSFQSGAEVSLSEATAVAPRVVAAITSSDRLAGQINQSVSASIMGGELVLAGEKFKDASAVSFNELREVAPTFVARVESDPNFASSVQKVADAKLQRVAGRLVAEIMGAEDLERIDTGANVQYYSNKTGRGIEVSKTAGKIAKFISGARDVELVALKTGKSGSVLLESQEFDTADVSGAIERFGLTSVEKGAIKSVAFADSAILAGNSFALADGGATLFINRQQMPNLASDRRLPVEITRASTVRARSDMGVKASFAAEIQDGWQAAKTELASSGMVADLRGLEGIKFGGEGADQGRLARTLGTGALILAATAGVFNGLPGYQQGVADRMAADMPVATATMQQEDLSQKAFTGAFDGGTDISGYTIERGDDGTMSIVRIGADTVSGDLGDQDISATQLDVQQDIGADIASLDHSVTSDHDFTDAGNIDYQTAVPHSVALLDAMSIGSSMDQVLAADQDRMIARLSFIDVRPVRISRPAPAGGDKPAPGGDEDDPVVISMRDRAGALGRRRIHRDDRDNLDIKKAAEGAKEPVVAEGRDQGFQRRGLAGLENIQRIEDVPLKARNGTATTGAFEPAVTQPITTQSLQPTVVPPVTTTEIITPAVFPTTIMPAMSGMFLSSAGQGATSDAAMLANSTQVGNLNIRSVTQTGIQSESAVLASANTAANGGIYANRVGSAGASNFTAAGSSMSSTGIDQGFTPLNVPNFEMPTAADVTGVSAVASSGAGYQGFTPLDVPSFDLPRLGDRAVLSATVADQRTIAVAKIGLASDTQMYNLLWSRVDNPQSILPIIRDVRRAKQSAIEDPSQNVFTSLKAMADSPLEGVREFARLLDQDPNLTTDIDSMIQLNQSRDVRAVVTPSVRRKAKDRIQQLQSGSDKGKTSAKRNEAAARLEVASKLQLREALLQTDGITEQEIPVLVDQIIQVRADNKSKSTADVFESLDEVASAVSPEYARVLNDPKTVDIINRTISTDDEFERIGIVTDDSDFARGLRQQVVTIKAGGTDTESLMAVLYGQSSAVDALDQFAMTREADFNAMMGQRAFGELPEAVQVAILDSPAVQTALDQSVQIRQPVTVGSKWRTAKKSERRPNTYVPPSVTATEGQNIQDVELDMVKFADQAGLEDAVQKRVDQDRNAMAAAGLESSGVSERGALIIGDQRLDTIVFPGLNIQAPALTQELRGYSARTFPDVALAANPRTGQLLMRLKANITSENGKPQIYLRVNEDVFVNKSDLWDTYSAADQQYLGDLGFGPGMSVDAWGQKIAEVVRTTTRTIDGDGVTFTKDLPGSLQYGSIGTRRSYHFSADFIAKTLTSNLFRLPGDTVIGVGEIQTHPEQVFTGFNETLALRVGEDLINRNPSIAQVYKAIQIGSQRINKYPSLSDIMMVIDSQYENYQAMKPLVQTDDQYQEYALTIVSTTAEGQVLGSKTFAYDSVVRAGEVETFDKLIDRAYRSMISQTPDVGLMSEGIQEIARYTQDGIAPYMGTGKQKTEKAVLARTESVPTPSANFDDFVQKTAVSQSAGTTFVPAEQDIVSRTQRLQGLSQSREVILVHLARNTQEFDRIVETAKKTGPVFEANDEAGQLVIRDVTSNEPVKVSKLPVNAAIVTRSNVPMRQNDPEVQALAQRMGLSADVNTRQSEILSSTSSAQFARAPQAEANITNFTIAAVQKLTAPTMALTGGQVERMSTRVSLPTRTPRVITSQQSFATQFTADPKMKIGMAVIAPVEDGGENFGEVGSQIQQVLMPTIATAIAETGSKYGVTAMANGNSTVISVPSSLSPAEVDSLNNEISANVRSLIPLSFGVTEVAMVGVSSADRAKISSLPTMLGDGDVFNGLIAGDDGKTYMVFDRTGGIDQLDNDAQRQIAQFNDALRNQNISGMVKSQGDAKRLFSPEIDIKISEPVRTASASQSGIDLQASVQDLGQTLNAFAARKSDFAKLPQPSQEMFNRAIQDAADRGFSFSREQITPMLTPTPQAARQQLRKAVQSGQNYQVIGMEANQGLAPADVAAIQSVAEQAKVTAVFIPPHKMVLLADDSKSTEEMASIVQAVEQSVNGARPDTRRIQMNVGVVSTRNIGNQDAFEMAGMVANIDPASFDMTTTQTSAGTRINFLDKQSTTLPDAVRQAFLTQRDTDRSATSFKAETSAGKKSAIIATVSDPVASMLAANLEPVEAGPTWIANNSGNSIIVYGNVIPAVSARSGGADRAILSGQSETALPAVSMQGISFDKGIKAISLDGRKQAVLVGKDDTVAADIIDTNGDVLVAQGSPVEFDGGGNITRIGSIDFRPQMQDTTAVAPVISIPVEKDLQFVKVKAVNYVVDNAGDLSTSTGNISSLARVESYGVDISDAPEIVLKATGLDQMPSSNGIIRISPEQFDQTIGEMADSKFETVLTDLASFINTSAAAEARSSAVASGTTRPTFSQAEIDTFTDNFLEKRLDEGRYNPVEVMQIRKRSRPGLFESVGAGKVAVVTGASKSQDPLTVGKLTAILHASVENANVISVAQAPRAVALAEAQSFAQGQGIVAPQVNIASTSGQLKTVDAATLAAVDSSSAKTSTVTSVTQARPQSGIAASSDSSSQDGSNNVTPQGTAKGKSLRDYTADNFFDNFLARQNSTSMATMMSVPEWVAADMIRGARDKQFMKQWEGGHSTQMTSGVKTVMLNRDELAIIVPEIGDSQRRVAGVAFDWGAAANNALGKVNHLQAGKFNQEDRVVFLADDLTGAGFDNVNRHERRHQGAFALENALGAEGKELRNLGNQIVQAVEANPSLDPQMFDFIQNRRKGNYQTENLFDEVVAEGHLRMRDIRSRAKELGITVQTSKTASSDIQGGAQIVDAAKLTITDAPSMTAPKLAALSNIGEMSDASVDTAIEIAGLNITPMQKATFKAEVAKAKTDLGRQITVSLPELRQAAPSLVEAIEADASGKLADAINITASAPRITAITRASTPSAVQTATVDAAKLTITEAPRMAAPKLAALSNIGEMNDASIDTAVEIAGLDITPAQKATFKAEVAKAKTDLGRQVTVSLPELRQTAPNLVEAIEADASGKLADAINMTASAPRIAAAATRTATPSVIQTATVDAAKLTIV
ncbi:MAG: hypothetical protein KC897_05855, partial [Candidatus Omnitrophica bacterium]|nr:hypothetical protein [Candidatus Omnitrophota bacterium]